jgi:hypothetical protein
MLRNLLNTATFGLIAANSDEPSRASAELTILDIEKMTTQELIAYTKKQNQLLQETSAIIYNLTTEVNETREQYGELKLTTQFTADQRDSEEKQLLTLTNTIATQIKLEAEQKKLNQRNERLQEDRQRLVTEKANFFHNQNRLNDAIIDANNKVDKALKEASKCDWVKWVCSFFIVVGLGLCATGVGAVLGVPVLGTVGGVMGMLGISLGGFFAAGGTGTIAYRTYKKSNTIVETLHAAQETLQEANIPTYGNSYSSMTVLLDQPQQSNHHTGPTHALGLPRSRSQERAQAKKSSFWGCLSCCCFWRSAAPVQPISVSANAAPANQSILFNP